MTLRLVSLLNGTSGPHWMIEVVRSEEDYRALLEAALDQELERARAGLTQTVTSKAAARFLGVHFDTLGSGVAAPHRWGRPSRKAQDSQVAGPISTCATSTKTWWSGKKPGPARRPKSVVC